MGLSYPSATPAQLAALPPLPKTFFEICESDPDPFVTWVVQRMISDKDLQTAVAKSFNKPLPDEVVSIEQNIQEFMSVLNVEYKAAEDCFLRLKAETFLRSQKKHISYTESDADYLKYKGLNTVQETENRIFYRYVDGDGHTNQCFSKMWSGTVDQARSGDFTIEELVAWAGTRCTCEFGEKALKDCSAKVEEILSTY
jgi:hypothetical protein